MNHKPQPFAPCTLHPPFLNVVTFHHHNSFNSFEVTELCLSRPTCKASIHSSSWAQITGWTLPRATGQTPDPPWKGKAGSQKGEQNLQQKRILRAFPLASWVLTCPNYNINYYKDLQSGVLKLFLSHPVTSCHSCYEQNSTQTFQTCSVNCHCGFGFEGCPATETPSKSQARNNRNNDANVVPIWIDPFWSFLIRIMLWRNNHETKSFTLNHMNHMLHWVATVNCKFSCSQL